MMKIEESREETRMVKEAVLFCKKATSRKGAYQAMPFN
jgi:hypothetical protein